MARPTILLVEPWFAGSHRAWAEGYQRHSRNRIELLTSEPAGWRATLDESAGHLAQRIASKPALIIASSMLDLAGFREESGLTDVPSLLYLHENQLTYDRAHPDLVRGAINWRSVTAADRVAFNSQFHLDDFFDAAPQLGVSSAAITGARAAASVLPVGIDLSELAGPDLRDGGPPVVLWSHRWEYDKNPDALVEAVRQTSDLPFRLILTGEGQAAPEYAAQIRTQLGDRLVHTGFAARDEYAALLRRSDLVLSTARQEFFGVSIAEAMACGVVPLVPDRLAYPELLGTDLSGCHYEAGSLPARLRSAIEAPEEWTPFRAAARSAGERFAWDRVAPRYDELIESML